MFYLFYVFTIFNVIQSYNILHKVVYSAQILVLKKPLATVSNRHTHSSVFFPPFKNQHMNPSSLTRCCVLALIGKFNYGSAQTYTTMAKPPGVFWSGWTIQFTPEPITERYWQRQRKVVLTEVRAPTEFWPDFLPPRRNRSRRRSEGVGKLSGKMSLDWKFEGRKDVYKKMKIETTIEERSNSVRRKENLRRLEEGKWIDILLTKLFMFFVYHFSAKSILNITFLEQRFSTRKLGVPEARSGTPVLPKPCNVIWY